MIKMKYRHTVTKQGFYREIPLFREESIGMSFESAIFATDVDTALCNFRSWQLDPWRNYELMNLERISGDDVPRDAWVFSGYQQGYRHNEKPRTRELSRA